MGRGRDIGHSFPSIPQNQIEHDICLILKLFVAIQLLRICTIPLLLTRTDYFEGKNEWEMISTDRNVQTKYSHSQ